MPIKSGLSHGLAAFLSIIIGSLLSTYLNTHSSLIRDSTEVVGRQLAGLLGVQVPAFVGGVIVIATLLSFAWGVAYHFSRFR
jgi:hypothetical protein